jgi:PAS domain S-box-containing protein
MSVMNTETQRGLDRIALWGSVILAAFLACLVLASVFGLVPLHIDLLTVSLLLIPTLLWVWILVARTRHSRGVSIADVSAMTTNEGEGFYRSIYENAVEALFRTTLDGKLVTCNPALARIAGYRSVQDMIENVPDAATMYVNPWEREEVVRQIRERGYAEDVIVHLRRKDGSTFWSSVTSRVVKDASGAVVAFDGSLLDVTARKEAELQLAASRRQLSDILHAASEFSIVATDRDGVVRVFSRGAELMLGYSAEEMVGKKSVRDLHLKEEVERRAAELSQELGRPIEGIEVFTARPVIGGSESREWTFVRKDGSHVPISLVVSAIRSADGEVSGFVGIATDIS